MLLSSLNFHYAVSHSLHTELVADFFLPNPCYCFRTLLFYSKMQVNKTPWKCFVKVLVLIPVIIVAPNIFIIIMHWKQ